MLNNQMSDYSKHIKLNLVMSSYVLILLGRLISKKKNEKTNNSNYFIYNSISFNLYKKNLNKYNITIIGQKKGKNKNFKPNSLSINPYKKYVNFGKLTWYWVFRTMTNSRFLLNYKEFKNYFAKSMFLKYESNLLLYDKKYNLWKKNINIHLKNSLPLYRKIAKKKRKITGMQLYNFPKKIKLRKRAPKYGKIDTFLFSKKNKLNFKFLYKDRKKYKKQFGINHKCLIKDKLIKTLKFFFKKKKRRRYSLKPKKWVLKWAKKKLFIRIRKKLKIQQIKSKLITDNKLTIGYFFSKSIFRIKKARNSLKKSLWYLKISKNSYFGNLSKSFKRKRLNNNLILFRNNKNNINLFLKKNKKNIKKLFISYLFPKNIIDLKKKSDFESIIFNKTISEVANFNVNTNNLITGYKNLAVTSEVSNVNKIIFKKNKINLLLKNNNNLVIVKENLTNNNKVFISKKKKQKNYFFIKNLKKKKNIEFLDKVYYIKKKSQNNKIINSNINHLKSHKAFINFFYKKKINLLTIFNIKNLEIQNFRFILNKKRLNTIITNIFMENFLIDYFYSNLYEKRSSAFLKGVNSRYFKFILILKKLYKKKQLRIRNINLKKKKKLISLFKKKKHLKYFLKTTYKFLPDYDKKFQNKLNYLFPGKDKQTLKITKIRIFKRLTFWNKSTNCFNMRMYRGHRLKLRFKRFRKILFWKKKIRALSFWSKSFKFKYNNINLDCPKLKRRAILLNLKWKNLIQPLIRFEKSKLLYTVTQTYPRLLKKIPNKVNFKSKKVDYLLNSIIKQKKIKLIKTKFKIKDTTVMQIKKKKKYFFKALQKKNIIKIPTPKPYWLYWKSTKKWTKKMIKYYGFRSWEVYKKQKLTPNTSHKVKKLMSRNLKRFFNKHCMFTQFYKKKFIFKFLNFKFKNFKLINSVKIFKKKIINNHIKLNFYSKLKLKNQAFFKILNQRRNSKIFQNYLKYFRKEKKKIIKKKLKILKKKNKYLKIKFFFICLKKKNFQKISINNFLFLKFLMLNNIKNKKEKIIITSLKNNNFKLLYFTRKIKTWKNYKPWFNHLKSKILKKKKLSLYTARLKIRANQLKRYGLKKKIKYTLKKKIKKLTTNKLRKHKSRFIRRIFNLKYLQKFGNIVNINTLNLLKKKNEINLNSKNILIRKINYKLNNNIIKERYISDKFLFDSFFKKNSKYLNYINSKNKLKLKIINKYPTIFVKKIKIKSITFFNSGKNKWKYIIKNTKKQNMKQSVFFFEIKNLSDMLKNIKINSFLNNITNSGLKNSFFLKKMNIINSKNKSLLFETINKILELGILINPSKNITRFINKQKIIKKKCIKHKKSKIILISKILKQESRKNKKKILKFIRLNWQKKIKIHDFFRKKKNLIPESKIFKKKLKKKSEKINLKIKSTYFMRHIKRRNWQVFLKTSEITQTNIYLSKIRKFNFLKVIKKSKNFKKTIRKNKIFLKKIKKYSRRMFRLARFSIRRAIRRKLKKLVRSAKNQSNILKSIKRRNRRIFYIKKIKKKKFYKNLKNNKKIKYRILKKKKNLLIKMYKKLPKKIKIGIYQKLKITRRRNIGIEKKLKKKSKLFLKIKKKLKQIKFKKRISRRYFINKKWQKIHFKKKLLEQSNNKKKIIFKNNKKFRYTNLNYLSNIVKPLNDFEIIKLKKILPFNLDYYFLKNNNLNIKFINDNNLKFLKKNWITKLNNLSNNSLLKNYKLKNRITKKSKNMSKFVITLIKTARSKMKLRRALFFKISKFNGASYLKKNRIILRLKLKKIFNMRVGCYLKKEAWRIRCRKFRKKWRFKNYFWKKLRKGIKSVIVGKLNDNIWYKKKGIWFEHLRKNNKHRKFKNFWIKTRWREYGKRKFPKDWYKIRRRKFPLKSGKKNWSLKITKHYNFFYFKFIRNQTTYDSSYVYFDYLSIFGRHNKKIKNSGKYKLARRVEHLIHFPWETIPSFPKIMGFKKKKKFWNKISSYQNYLYNFKSLNKNDFDLKSLFTPSADSFGVKKYKSIKNVIFQKSIQLFINSWNNYLDSRFTLFTVSSKLWFKKLNNILKYSGIQTKHTWLTNKIVLPFEHTSELKLSKLKKFNYILKTTILIDKLAKINLNNVLVDAYFNFKRISLVSTYKLACKSNFRTFNGYNLGNFSFTKNKLYRLGYSDFNSIFVDNSITTIKISKLYKTYKAVIPQLRTNFNISGGVCIKRDYFFTKKLGGNRYHIQFIQKIPKFIKKNFWIFNSFEINNSMIFSSNL